MTYPASPNEVGPSRLRPDAAQFWAGSRQPGARHRHHVAAHRGRREAGSPDRAAAAGRIREISVFLAA